MSHGVRATYRFAGSPFREEIVSSEVTDTSSAPAPSEEVYGEHVFSHLRPDEAERLEALAQALDENTFQRLGRLPLREDWHCLEIGAGLGTTARWLAARCPRGRVVATDIDTRLFPDLDGRNGWEAREHDVTRDEFPTASFDLIHARWARWSPRPTPSTARSASPCAPPSRRGSAPAAHGPVAFPEFSRRRA